MSWLRLHMQINRKLGRNRRPRGFTQNPGLCGPGEGGVRALIMLAVDGRSIGTKGSPWGGARRSQALPEAHCNFPWATAHGTCLEGLLPESPPSAPAWLLAPAPSMTPQSDLTTTPHQPHSLLEEGGGGSASLAMPRPSPRPRSMFALSLTSLTSWTEGDWEGPTALDPLAENWPGAKAQET